MASLTGFFASKDMGAYEVRIADGWSTRQSAQTWEDHDCGTRCGLLAGEVVRSKQGS